MLNPDQQLATHYADWRSQHHPAPVQITLPTAASQNDLNVACAKAYANAFGHLAECGACRGDLTYLLLCVAQMDASERSDTASAEAIQRLIDMHRPAAGARHG